MCNRRWNNALVVAVEQISSALTVGIFLLALSGRGAAADVLVLDQDSHWRVDRTWVPGCARMQDGRLVPLVPGAGLKGPWHALKFSPEPGRKYALPPWPALEQGWADVPFDDSTWSRQRGFVSVNSPYFMRFQFTPRWDLSLLRMRAKFLVADPAAVTRLMLDVEYQGGIVVYLNGREVAREHLPAGPLRWDTPAEDYPETAGRRKDDWSRCAGLDRQLQAAALPVNRLRKGVNVLALEIHRAPLPEKMLRSGVNWLPLELRTLRWTAPDGSAVASGAERPAGLCVCAFPPTWRVCLDDPGDRTAADCRIRIVACRNSTFSGQAVIFCDKPLGAVSGTVGPLLAVGGNATIPAEAVQVRYARPDQHSIEPRETGTVFVPMTWFDGLEEEPPAGVPLRVWRWRQKEEQWLASQPVWVTVRVPAAAQAGEYRGKLRLDIAGQAAIDVPLEVRVHDWTMPDSKEFATFLEMIHSPDTLARYYGVPMWSEEHWKLLERSFALTAQCGNKLVFIPLFAHARFGNDDGMLRWVRTSHGWEYDFSVIERYLSLAVKYFGRQIVVIWHTTEPAHADLYWRIRHGGRMPPRKRPQVSVLQPDGSLGLIEAPAFGTAEARAFWTPVFDRIRERVQGMHLTKRAMTLGTEQDLGVDPAFFADMKSFAPGFTWSRCTHPTPPTSMKMPNGIPYGYASDVYGGILLQIPGRTVPSMCGWKWIDNEDAGVHAHWPRNELCESAAFGYIQAIMENLIASGPGYEPKYGYAGLAHEGAEFWPVPGKGRDGAAGTILNKFPEAIWGSISIANGTSAWLAPGPHHALATARLEILREGIEEANVRVFLERALTDATARDRLGEQLAAKVQALLDQRLQRFRLAKQREEWSACRTAVGLHRDELLAAAAEVARRLGTR